MIDPAQAGIREAHRLPFGLLMIPSLRQTSLLVFLFSTAWVGVLFAFSTGPTPGVSGVFGANCNQNGCHTGNQVDAPGGALSLVGLPEQWTPGQTYPLTVSIQRAGAARYGFQLTSVSNTTTKQAGSFSIPESERGVWAPCFVGTQLFIVNCSVTGAIQYPEHNEVTNTTGTFRVNWTAPASSSVGAVRFNVAANAANGNGQVTGDYIYTREYLLSPAASPGVSSLTFAIANPGGTVVNTTGGGTFVVGYSRIQADAGKSPPAGVAILGLRQSNALVSETAISSSAAITSGRIYAEVNGGVNTGVAIANPNDAAAAVTFHFTNASGQDFGGNVTTIPARSQMAAFLTESPFIGGSDVQGTFSFSSNVPVSVAALRGHTNDRGEFLMTTQPVTDISAPVSSNAVVLPHFADGAGWITKVVLVNPTDSTLSGRVEFWSQGNGPTAGAPVTLTVNGQSGSAFNYSIPRRSSQAFTTSGDAPTTTPGSVRIMPDSSPAPSSSLVFSYKPANTTITEAGVPGIQGKGFRMYAETTSRTAAPGTIQTGVAIASTSATATSVTLDLFRLDGASAIASVALTIPANGQRAAFLHELFPASWTLPFQGILRIRTTGSSDITVIGLRGRFNERNEFLITTLHATNEDLAPPTSELLFPHFATGGGFTTQFILFSGATGQPTTGTVFFVGWDGNPMSLSLQ